MTHGAFGGVEGADYIAVLAMDGQLQVVEQERPSFLRQLPNVLLPGPLLYVPSTDCLVTTTATYSVAAFRFAALAAAEHATPSTSKSATAPPSYGSTPSPAGSLQPAWQVNIGAPIHALHLGRFSRNLAATQADILALAPTAVYSIREAGAGQSPHTASLAGTTAGGDDGGVPTAPFRFQRRLDFYPIAAAVIPRMASTGLASTSDNFMLLSATSPAQMRVYREGAVQWAAQLQNMPIAVTVGEFGGVKGLIVSMDARGGLSLAYLGTDPPSQGIAALTGSGKQLDYAAMDAEHRSLLQTIRDAQSEHRSVPKERLLMRVQPARDATFTPSGSDSSIPGAALGSAMTTVLLYMTYTGEEALEDVSLSLALPGGITCAQSTLTLPTVPGAASSKAGTEPLTVPLQLMHSGNGVPSSLAATVVATFMAAAGEPRTASVAFTLPLSLVAVPVLPIRSGHFNLTLELSAEAPFLPSLWEDLLSQAHADDSVPKALASANGMVFSLRYLCGADATVVAAKSGGRLKIYSSTLEALGLFLGQLLHRMNTSTASKGGELSYTQPLPLADVFTAIDTHFDARIQLRKASSQLNDTAAQFRVIQKRLLARFKDKNPAPLNQLDQLLMTTHRSIVTLADSYAAAQHAVAAAANRLSCMLTLLHLLMRMQFALDAAACDMLTAHLPCTVSALSDSSNIHALDQGWQERAAAGVTHLLRTVLAKNSRESSAPMPDMSMASDTSKLKRHMSIMCDRLSKGATLV
jgi:Bardet-Biedl syndrome 9 protein